MNPKGVTNALALRGQSDTFIVLFVRIRVWIDKKWLN